MSTAAPRGRCDTVRSREHNREARRCKAPADRDARACCRRGEHSALPLQSAANPSGQPAGTLSTSIGSRDCFQSSAGKGAAGLSAELLAQQRRSSAGVRPSSAADACVCWRRLARRRRRGGSVAAAGALRGTRPSTTHSDLAPRPPELLTARRAAGGQCRVQAACSRCRCRAGGGARCSHGASSRNGVIRVARARCAVRGGGGAFRSCGAALELPPPRCLAAAPCLEV